MSEDFFAPLHNFYADQRPVDWSFVFGNDHPVVLEIGFGLGEVLIEKAMKTPQINYVGIEIIWERFYRTLKRFHQIQGLSTLDNIRLLNVDARVSIERLFVERSLDEVYALFPCPWPKKTHIKHRLFNQEFLRLLNSRMSDQSHLQIVTDDFVFADWIEGELSETGFALHRRLKRSSFATKFERKWQQEKDQYEFVELILDKQRHLRHGDVKDENMKSYMLDAFAPQAFEFKKRCEDIAVICKNFMYDERQQKGLVYLIVTEGSLTQHFRVMIKKRADGWRICKEEGQQFFPTPGIQKSIQWVYEAAKNNNP